MNYVDDLTDQSDDDTLETKNRGVVDKSDEALSLINLDGLIKNYISRLAKSREESKKLNEMLEDILSNDPIYREHNEKANEANKLKLTTKQQLLKQPQAADLNEKIKAIKAEVKEAATSLSAYLQEYQKVSGANEIEDNEGELREIVSTSRLVKKSRG